MGETVRRARVTDREGIQRVARRSWHAAHDHIVGPEAVEEFLAEHYGDERLRRLIGSSRGTWIVAEAGGDDIVGFAATVPWRDREDTWALASIYVLPDHWGEGIGRQLLDRVESVVRSAGGERLRLVVMADNDVGIGFYESTGFERVDDHYDGDLEVEGYVYAKAL